MSEERKRWVDPVVLLDRKFKPDAVLWREATARRAVDDCAYCPQPSKEPA